MIARRSSEPVRAVVLAAALVGGYLLFRELVTLAIVLVITLIIALPLSACADALERRRVPRAAGAAVGLLGGLALLAGALATIVPPFVTQVRAFIDRIPAILDALRARIGQATGEQPSDVGRRLQDGLEGFYDDPMKLIGPVAEVGLGLAGVLATFVLVLMTAYWIAVRPEPLVDGLLSLFPARRRDDVERVLRDTRTAWLGWMQGVAVDMVISGVLLYIGLRLIDLDFALVFAVLSALLVVIPYIGSIVSALPPVLFALADSPTKALLALAVFVVVQQIEGNVLVPLIMSRMVTLHPAVIVVGVVLVGRLFGIIGLFVAVPLVSAVVTIVRVMWVEPLERDDDDRRSGRLTPPTPTTSTA